MKPVARNKGVGGAKAYFAKKLVEGLPIYDAARTAYIGHRSLTDGAKIAQRVQLASTGIRHGISDEAELLAALHKVGKAIVELDAKTLQEIADYLMHEKHARANGARAEWFMHAANFVGYCRHVPRQSGSLFEKVAKRTPGLFAAWNKPQFTPNISEIIQYLSEVMGDEAPDDSQVRRAAPALGIQTRPRRTRIN